jgi:hypothetical protein
MNDRVYSLDTIKTILYAGISSEITEGTRQIINQLSNEFNAITQKTFIPSSKKNYKNIKPINIIEKKPINESLNNTEQIRSYLNKISDKNYDIISKQIIHFMNEMPEEEIEFIMNIFFDIATTNRFFTKLYASLYSQLCKLFPTINTLLKIKISCFFDTIKNIESGEPEIDYENFIRINEINEKRKVVASFYYYLMEEGVIPTEEIIKIIRQLLFLVWSYLNQENKKKDIEEIIDIIFILYNKNLLEKSIIYNEICIEDKNIEEIILLISKCSVRETPGLTNKAYFKIMDIIEKKCPTSNKKNI